MVRKIASIVAACFSVFTLAFVASLPAWASVGRGAQYDQNGAGSYVNAWGGNVAGHLIKVNVGQTANNDFTLVSNGNYVQLWSTPSSGGSSNCISDNGNNSGDAKAGLNNCANGTPWGANFILSFCTNSGQNGFEFKNAHWGGFLEANGGQGAQYYLNAPATCFTDENPF